MGTFVKPGANVIIKPNICVAYRIYDQAATTNPWVVGALVKLCFEAGAGRVRVMDAPFDGTANKAYKYSGIQEEGGSQWRRRWKSCHRSNTRR